MAIVSVMSHMLAIIFLLYLICYFGNRMTVQFHCIGDGMYDSAWYLLPLCLQRNFPMMIALSNKTIYIQGFVGYDCTHVTLMKVRNLSN